MPQTVGTNHHAPYRNRGGMQSWKAPDVRMHWGVPDPVDLISGSYAISFDCPPWICAASKAHARLLDGDVHKIAVMVSIQYSLARCKPFDGRIDTIQGAHDES